MNKNIFIAGTNTGIGKTLISAMLLSAGLSHGLTPKYFKPIQTGDELDCVTIKDLTNCDDDIIHQPVYSFALPETPYLAARAENKKVDHQEILAYYQKNLQDTCIVEGAGGFLSPICEKTLGRDLVKTLDLPILIIASTALGTMNHTLLTIESAQNANIPIKGIILSGNHRDELSEILTHFSSVPVLAEVPMLNLQDKEKFSSQAASIFHKALFLEIFS